MFYINTIATITYSDEELEASVKFTERELFKKFIDALNLDISEINRSIEAFNGSQTHADKLKHLQAIYTLRQQINHHYPLNFLSICKPFQEHIQQGLWNTLREQFSKLGIPSLVNIRALRPDQLTSTIQVDKASLPEILTQMPHDKLKQLMTILWQNIDVVKQLQFLYHAEEAGFDEFKAFLSTHVITPITQSTDGNSRNFKIERIPRNDSHAVVLKVDARCEQPKAAELSLRDHHFQHLAKTYGEDRQATLDINGSTFTAALTIIEFFEKGDLYTFSKKKSTPNELVTNALNFYTQMMTILLDMQRLGFAFTDAKNNNWIFGEDNCLKVGDTKSLVFLTSASVPSCSETSLGREELLLDYKYIPNIWCTGAYSKHLVPPEVKPDLTKPFSADKMHVYMVGKNLYEFLTQCNRNMLSDVAPRLANQFSNSYFNHDIFKSTIGQGLRRLITKMVTPNAHDRISLTEAYHMLQTIPHTAALQDACIASLTDIINTLLSVNPADQKALDFGSNQYQRIINTANQSELIQIQEEFIQLQKTLTPIVTELKAIVAKFNNSFFNQDKKKDKTQAILTAFAQIPVHDRARLFSTHTPEIHAFQKALALHLNNEEHNRLLINEDGSINEQFAARTFVTFKQRLEVQAVSVTLLGSSHSSPHSCN